jgi:group II intron reverse transcriptase/maturase
MVNKINPRVVDYWLIVKGILPIIVKVNNVYTCGTLISTAFTLYRKVLAYSVKTTGDLRYFILPIFGLNYVMPGTFSSFRTRSFKKKIVFNSGFRKSSITFFRGADVSRSFSSKTVALGCSKEVEQLIDTLKAASIKNDIKEVNRLTLLIISQPIFWVLCYESIKSNPGMEALGGSSLLPDSKNLTLDNIDQNFFLKLTSNILTGKFKFGPYRGVEIPKNGKKPRPIRIADSRDKIVQKGLAIILEILSEHRFLENSFGFRRGKSCHDAIHFIKNKVPSGLWAIEGDIEKCFDSIDQKRLVSLVKKKYVSQQVFIDLLYKGFKARTLSVTSKTWDNAGVAQGSIVSPILANIYLHELDMFIEHPTSPLLQICKKKSNVTPNPKYSAFLKPTEDENLVGQTIRNTKGKLKMYSYFQKLRISKIKKARKLNLRASHFKKRNLKTVYVRYADDWLLFVWGTYNDCKIIKKLIQNFLLGDLNLKLSDEKTKITYLKRNKVNFLGFQISQSKPIFITPRKDLMPQGTKDLIANIRRLKTRRKTIKYRGYTTSLPRIRINFSMTAVLQSLVDKQMVRRKSGGINTKSIFFPTSYKPALSYEIPNIINYLKSVFRGLAYYYGIAHNWFDAKTLYNYYGLYCTAMTIAHKTKSKISKIFKKYGNNLTVTDQNNSVLAKFGTLENDDFKKSVKFFKPYTRIDTDALLKKHLKISKKHLIVRPCAICGTTPTEMHHIKHVRTVLKKKLAKKTKFNGILEALRLVNRKTLPLCKEHHNMVHNGLYDGESLKSIFKSFKEQGVGYNKSKANVLINKVGRLEQEKKKN